MIETVLKDYQALSIYGTGYNASRLIKLLCKEYTRKIDRFIVSDGKLCNNTFCGRDVIEFSEYDQAENEIILVSVGGKPREEVIKMLDDKEVKYYCLQESDFRVLNRKKHPVENSVLLQTSNPVSRDFGLDRGKPIDRYYIESFFEIRSRDIQDVGKTLEVGETCYSKMFFPNSNHDILDYSSGMDLTNHLSIPQSFYDLFICTQTYNFIYDVRSAIKGSFDLLKPGGILLATVAGNISQVSKYDMDRWGDYWRFTYRSIEMLMKESFGEDVKVYPYGNAMAATAFIQGMCVEDVDVRLLDECDPEYAIVIGVVAKK